MVSMINFYTYKEDVKRALIRRKEQLNIDDYPLDWAWITYAFSCEGTEDNPLLEPMLQQASGWAASAKALEYDRNIGALGISCFVLNKTKHEDWERINNLISEKLKNLVTKGMYKFHPLNDPEVAFGLSMGLGRELSNEIPGLLLKHLNEGARSESLRRRLLFTAALTELGIEIRTTNILPPTDQIRIDDLITALWFVERYKTYVNSLQMKSTLWDIFVKSKEIFSLEFYEEVSTSGQRILSSADLAMLYEVLVLETKEPNAIMLFDNYPLHPRIKNGMAGSLFKKGEYFNAVFEATKVLNDFVRKITKSQKSEINLMQSAMGDPKAKEIKNPQIKFNELNLTTPDYRSQQNEQKGLSMIAHGIFYAFRHPKGHEPEDSSWGDIHPYEALDQLIVISYIMNRIEKAAKAQCGDNHD